MLRRLALATMLLLAVMGCANAAAKPTIAPTVVPSTRVVPSIGGGPPRVTGTVTAGPTCPVEKASSDWRCASRPVAGAVIIATNEAGEEIGRATTGTDGTYTLAVGQTGTATITAQPVSGLMAAPQPTTVTFTGPSEVKQLDFSYDAGIR